MTERHRTSSGKPRRAAKPGEARCESINPVGLLGNNCQCDLPAGHDGRHQASRSRDGWDSVAYWAQDQIDDEVRALRKVAAAAARYLEHSKLTESMYWNDQLELHNSLADWRNLKAKEQQT